MGVPAATLHCILAGRMSGAHDWWGGRKPLWGAGERGLLIYYIKLAWADREICQLKPMLLLMCRLRGPHMYSS